MSITGSLDANVLLRLLLEDLPEQHDAALALLTGGGRFAVSDVALIEVAFVLGRAYGLTRAQQREAVLGLLDQPQIEGSRDVFAGALERYVVRPKLSLEDCYLVAAAEHHGYAPLWTFDRKLVSQSPAKAIGTR